MSVLLEIHHRTRYRYANPVSFGEHRLIYRPRSSHDLRVLESVLEVTPTSPIRWIQDVFDNSVALVTPTVMSSELCFDVHLLIEHYGIHNLELPLALDAVNYPFHYTSADRIDLGALLVPQYDDSYGVLRAFANQFLPHDGQSVGTRELLRRITEYIRHQFAYVPRDSEGTQSPSETLQWRSGSCRDFALLMIETVRWLGFAARFVSGYLYVPSLDPSTTAQASSNATHAWVEVYLPGAGWSSYDPTNQLFGGPDLIRVAFTRDAWQALPVTGSFVGAAGDFIDMRVDVTIQRISPPA